MPTIEADRCVGCGLCVRACPNGVLAMVGGKAVVAHPEACDYTGNCERICPVGAVWRPYEIIAPEMGDAQDR